MARATTICLLAALAWTLPQFAFAAGESESPRDIIYAPTPDAPRGQLPAEAARKSAGCMSCHTATDSENMHQSPVVILGCTDCHGGDATVIGPAAAHAGAASGAGGGDAEQSEEGGHDYAPAYRAAMDAAHVQPTLPETWHYPSSANPEHSFTVLNRESPEYVRFVNPSDLRVARESCGACHLQIIQALERHLMSTGAMLWGGASYNNGILPFKNYILGESFTREGEAATIMSPLEPDERMKRRGILPALVPLPPWEVIPAGDIFRVFERGGRNILNIFPEIALPNSTGLLQRLEEPGRPDLKQSNRGLGTGLRVAIPVLNIHKTRLSSTRSRSSLLWASAALARWRRNSSDSLRRSPSKLARRSEETRSTAACASAATCRISGLRNMRYARRQFPCRGGSAPPKALRLRISTR